MPTAAKPLTLSAGATADITGGVAIGLANQTGVTAMPSYTAIVGSAIITITPKAGGCVGVAQTTLVTVVNCSSGLVSAGFVTFNQFNGAPYTFQSSTDGVNWVNRTVTISIFAVSGYVKMRNFSNNFGLIELEITGITGTGDFVWAGSNYLFLSLDPNSMITAEVDAALIAYNNLPIIPPSAGKSYTLSIKGGNAAPSAAGILAKNAAIAKGAVILTY